MQLSEAAERAGHVARSSHQRGMGPTSFCGNLPPVMSALLSNCSLLRATLVMLLLLLSML